MLLAVIACVAAGFFLGLSILPESSLIYVEQIITLALGLLLVTVGIDLGRNRTLLAAIRRQGPTILLLPAVSGLGSLLGTALVAAPLGLPLAQSMAVGAGFGWYSLSGILIADAGYPELGGLAFLANVLREIITLVAVPFLARRFGSYGAIASGGATTMDTTAHHRPQCGDEAAIPALIHGVVLSSIIPLLVTYLIRFF